WFPPVNINGRGDEPWDSYQIRLDEPVNYILKLLKDHSVCATFFILGYFAKRAPDLIKKIADEGHEIASHGYYHQSILNMTPEEFREDIEKSKEIIYNHTNIEVKGYRAPYFSITKKNLWAFDILKEYGFIYDSSVFPTNMHPDYGISDAIPRIHKLNNGLIEVPLSVVNLMGLKLPFAGGGYFRLYPYFLTKLFFNSCNKRNKPIVLYIHPWEFDYEQPRVRKKLVDYYRSYQNLKKTKNKLEKILNDYSFTNINHLLKIKGFLADEYISK
ncbi:MAG: hypothetical protein QG635_1588, partial [Bacteroidota bacterium]|nr:hypothetical protein [Bacteroidota bacterium]